ncbi:hypothetical protein FIV07_09230 [Mycobacterium sp. THAF192]|nr:hypothetical protein FIV07_09230 [Mycobacterium sp. THAF192]
MQTGDSLNTCVPDGGGSARLATLTALAVIGLFVPSCSGFRDDYSYSKGREYSSGALGLYQQGAARDYRDGCRQQLKMYERFGALGTGRENPPEVDDDDFMQGCIDGINGE